MAYKSDDTFCNRLFRLASILIDHACIFPLGSHVADGYCVTKVSYPLRSQVPDGSFEIKVDYPLRSQVPDFPPAFFNKPMSCKVIPRSTALHMS